VLAGETDPDTAGIAMIRDVRMVVKDGWILKDALN
jgi:hypothetical protein